MRSYTYNVPIGNTGVNFAATFSGSANEEYIENPIFEGSYKSHSVYGWYMSENANNITPGGLEQYGYRGGIALDSINSSAIVIYAALNPGLVRWGDFDVSSGQSQTGYADIIYSDYDDVSQFPYDALRWTDSRVDSVVELSVYTNIPIFETTAELETYITTGEGIENAVNYEEATAPTGRDFEIVNAWTHGVWLNDTQPQVTRVDYRNVRGRITSGSIALYPILGNGTKIVDGKLKYGIKSDATFYDLEYSTNGIDYISTSSFPFEYFLRKRTDELGEFDYALTFAKNIPVFIDENTAQGYLDGNVGIDEAIDWNEISQDYPINNLTGDELGSSEFGSAQIRSVFCQQYVVDYTCLSEIADDLYDTQNGGMWENFKKGLEMYGANPIDAVMGLSFWPVPAADLLKAGGYAPAEYIWFGGYGWHVTEHSGSASHIIYPDNEIIIGTIDIVPSFGGSWRDFEPYTKLYVMLPYCGTYQLDIERYIGRTCQVKYYVDTKTGGCVAVLSVQSETTGWFATDWFNGQMAVNQPITLTDFTSYMNSQMQVLLQGGGQASNSFGSAANSIANAAGGASLAGAALGAAGGAGIAGAAIGAKTVYGLTMNNINNFNKTKGGSSSMINCMLPQTVDFLFEIQEDCAPSNYGAMFGYPSMKSGSLNEFSGYLKCQSVKLNCPKATEREKERIKQMLLSGIYI